MSFAGIVGLPLELVWVSAPGTWALPGTAKRTQRTRPEGNQPRFRIIRSSSELTVVIAFEVICYHCPPLS